MKHIYTFLIFALGTLAGYGAAWTDARDLIERPELSLKQHITPRLGDCVSELEVLRTFTRHANYGD